MRIFWVEEAILQRKNKLTKNARVSVLPRGPFRLPDKLSQSFPVTR